MMIIIIIKKIVLMIMVILIIFLVINVVKSIKKKLVELKFFPYLFAQHRNYMVYEVRNSFFEK